MVTGEAMPVLNCCHGYLEVGNRCENGLSNKIIIVNLSNINSDTM